MTNLRNTLKNDKQIMHTDISKSTKFKPPSPPEGNQTIAHTTRVQALPFYPDWGWWWWYGYIFYGHFLSHTALLKFQSRFTASETFCIISSIQAIPVHYGMIINCKIKQFLKLILNPESKYRIIFTGANKFEDI
jgi:hypothetical protein